MWLEGHAVTPGSAGIAGDVRVRILGFVLVSWWGRGPGKVRLCIRTARSAHGHVAAGQETLEATVWAGLHVI